MDVLAKLFGSEAKVKIMRLFLFNPESPYSPNDIANRARISLPSVRHETALLRKMGLIKGKRFSHVVDVKRGRKTISKRKTEGGWILNQDFPHLPALRNLLVNTVLSNQDDIVHKLNSTGKMKLIIAAGVFIHDQDSRVDLLVVGDNLRLNTLDNVIRNIEAEIGKELKYAAFETSDFEYRLGMYDKLIRDIIDYPHKKLLNKLNPIL